MKTQRTPAQRRRTVTWSLIGLLFLALLLLSPASIVRSVAVS